MTYIVYSDMIMDIQINKLKFDHQGKRPYKQIGAKTQHNTTVDEKKNQ